MKVSIVIPILNEAATLPQLLDALNAQTYLPHEIIFVDAGSTDGGLALIAQWAMRSRLGEACCKLIPNPGGMPGANRNRGVETAQGEWIAFLDGGVYPEPDWLECLCACAAKHASKAVFGMCRFDAEPAFEKAVCALSYGCGATHPVLPASLFHRDVFTQAGMFAKNLRSAEDILWVRSLEHVYGPRTICTGALVHYRHFPVSLAAAVRKWKLYEMHSVRAGLRQRQQLFLIVFFPGIIAMLIFVPLLGSAFLLSYALIRGVVDPMRRSTHTIWWGDKPMAMLIALGLGIVLDGAKTAGSIAARLEKVVGVNAT